jgi:uncharacterized protein (TIGR01777 family)
MKRIAITGSSGLIGTALVRHLESAGHSVVRVRRGNPSDPSGSWNPETAWFREGALEGVDAVVHLAGANIAGRRWSPRYKEAIRSSRVDATRLLVDHLASLTARPGVLISASGVGYYGSRGDEELLEESSKGGGFLAGVVAAWELEALRARESGIRTVTVRTGVVLAAHDGALKKMLLPFRLGVGGPIGRGRRWFPWISLEDTVRAYAFALEAPLEGPVNTTAPRPVTNAEFTKALGRALRRPTVFPIPPLALKVLYGAEMAEETVLASQRAVPARLLEAGFEFRHQDIDDGLAAALR